MNDQSPISIAASQICALISPTRHHLNPGMVEEIIRKVELDAYRAGLLAAAKVAKLEERSSSHAEKAILTLRDNTTKLPKE